MYLSVYVYNPSSTGVCDDDIEDVCVRACASALIAKRGGKKKRGSRALGNARSCGSG